MEAPPLRPSVSLARTKVTLYHLVVSIVVDTTRLIGSDPGVTVNIYGSLSSYTVPGKSDFYVTLLTHLTYILP